MKRLLLAVLLLVSMAPMAFGASQLYKMKNGASVTPMGQELILSTNTMCIEFARIQGHFNAMTQQRDSETNFQTVADQWGILDSATNAVDETVADNLYQELNSMVGNAGPSLSQWCSRVKQ